MMRLEGKTALVTGGGSGIGRAITARFAGEGARVAIADRDAESGHAVTAEIRRAGGEALCIVADVSRETDAQRMVSAVVETFGGLDVLVNNAAIQVFGTVPDTDPHDWRRVMDVNLKGVYLGCKFAIPHMVAGGGGSIINMSSVLGLVGDPEMPAYGATKGALLSMTKAMAQAHGRQGIRSNCICPGDVATPLVGEYFDRQPDPEAARRQVADHYALGRIAEPEEIANVALFLASDESSFITGAAIVVDGGLTSRCY